MSFDPESMFGGKKRRSRKSRTMKRSRKSMNRKPHRKATRGKKRGRGRKH